MIQSYIFQKPLAIRPLFKSCCLCRGGYRDQREFSKQLQNQVPLGQWFSTHGPWAACGPVSSPCDILLKQFFNGFTRSKLCGCNPHNTSTTTVANRLRTTALDGPCIWFDCGKEMGSILIGSLEAVQWAFFVFCGRSPFVSKKQQWAYVAFYVCILPCFIPDLMSPIKTCNLILGGRM